MEAVKTTLYEQVANKLIYQIKHGAFKPGDKIPSIRNLAQELQVSVNTVKEAYWLLEDGHYIEGKPQSGYYVAEPNSPIPNLQTESSQQLKASDVTISSACAKILDDILNKGFVPLGIAIPDPKLLPLEKMHRIYSSQTPFRMEENFSYTPTAGLYELRVEIAKRVFLSGANVAPEDIIITNGCTEAVFLALSVLCKPGDTIVVESPFYFSFNLILKQLDLKVIEVPNHPQTGLNLDILEFVLERNKISACLTNHNFNNPLGSVMCDENKQRLVSILESYDIPLIEDDIYGDISYLSKRPKVCKTWDTKNNVILCSSFSKTISSGLRLGWIIPGKHYRKVYDKKTMISISSPSPTQHYAMSFLQSGGYDRYLRGFRKQMREQMLQIRSIIKEEFPKEIKVSLPEGGMVLWVEMPETVHSMDIYKKALDQEITVSPGTLYSFDDRYKNCIRINIGYWSEEIKEGLHRLAKIINSSI